ncbi:MAG: hypothetical protein WDA09_08345 [Bacteriovoracaceae bacterium]
MKRSLDLNLTGKFWQGDNNEWTARIESLDLEAKAPTPYRCLLNLIDLIESEEKSEEFRYSISVVDSGVFHLTLRSQ